MFVLTKNFKDEQPEISVTLRPEEWLDLIDAMKEEFEAVIVNPPSVLLFPEMVILTFAVSEQVIVTPPIVLLYL